METTLHKHQTEPAEWTAERAQLFVALHKAEDELEFRTKEKDKRCAELELANLELAFQIRQQELHVDEMLLENKNLRYQNRVSERRVADLIAAYQELDALHTEKEKRAAALAKANGELVLQNHEVERQAAQLKMANIELAYTNKEVEKRASGLQAENEELASQNSEKEQRATELAIAVKELEAFAFISSHDLQEPLRKILLHISQIEEDPEYHPTEKEQLRLTKIAQAAGRMRRLVGDLYTYSRLQATERHFELVSLNTLVEEELKVLEAEIIKKDAVVEVDALCAVPVILPAFTQLLHSLLSNALKFTAPERVPRITVAASLQDGEAAPAQKLEPGRTYCRLTVQDNGIGFDMEYRERIFTVFQRLHAPGEYPGTGIGLAVAKKVAALHGGCISAESKPGAGSLFTVYIPVSNN